jgi:hypothetical protein
MARPPAQATDEPRQPCALPATCQTPAGWGGDREPWPATVRELGPTGLSLTLRRRFERGTGLAIDLADPAEGGATLLARVVQVRAEPGGGWLLGCAFVSRLSDEELKAFLQSDARASAPAADQPGAPEPAHEPPAAGVLFQARLNPRVVLRWFVKKVELAGTWPLPKGRQIALRFPGTPGDRPVELEVRSCRRRHGCWVVNGRFVTAPPPQFLRAIGHDGR